MLQCVILRRSGKLPVETHNISHSNACPALFASSNGEDAQFAKRLVVNLAH